VTKVKRGVTEGTVSAKVLPSRKRREKEDRIGESADPSEHGKRIGRLSTTGRLYTVEQRLYTVEQRNCRLINIMKVFA
jgi:hypothetical protein